MEKPLLKKATRNSFQRRPLTISAMHTHAIARYFMLPIYLLSFSFISSYISCYGNDRTSISVVGGDHDFRNKLMTHLLPVQDQMNYSIQRGSCSGTENNYLLSILAHSFVFYFCCNFSETCGSSGRVISNYIWVQKFVF